MFINTLLIAFLFLGSLMGALGQTNDSTSIVRPGGILNINASGSLCSPAAVPIANVNVVPSTLALKVELGGCRVKLTQPATGEHVVLLQKAHTMQLSFLPGTGWTTIIGAVPVGLAPGTASLIIERVEPMATSPTETKWVTVSAVSWEVKVGEPAAKPAQVVLVGDETTLVFP